MTNMKRKYHELKIRNLNKSREMIYLKISQLNMTGYFCILQPLKTLEAFVVEDLEIGLDDKKCCRHRNRSDLA